MRSPLLSGPGAPRRQPFFARGRPSSGATRGREPAPSPSPAPAEPSRAPPPEMAPPLLLLLLPPLLRLCGCQVPDQSGDEATLSFPLSSEPARRVSPFFLSVTLSASLLSRPKQITLLGSRKLRTLARGLSPAFLRLGGARGDFTIFKPQQTPTSEEKICHDFIRKQATAEICDFKSAPLDFIAQLQSQWLSEMELIFQEQERSKFQNVTFTGSALDILYNFANCSNLHLIFGLNALLRNGSQWNSSNAQLILNYASSNNYIMDWELGNEPNSFFRKSGIHIDGDQLGQDFVQLRQLLNDYTLYKDAKIYGPDISSLSRTGSRSLLKSFLKSGGKAVNAVTWHQYYMNGRTATKEDFLSPDILDSLKTEAEQALEIVHSTVPDKSVWLGETGSAYGGGAPNLSNAYIDGFMWLDKLGLSALMGIDVVMRQTLYGGGSYHLVDPEFEPLPDYWLSLLHKKLVGTSVLRVALTGLDPRKLRVYLHCTNLNHSKYRKGDVTLFALNLYDSTKQLSLPDSFSRKQIDEYLLLPYGEKGLLSQSVQLNGQLLKMPNDETLPVLKGNPLIPGQSIKLPGFSFGFYVIRNAKVLACI